MTITWTNDRAELDGFQLRRETKPDLDQRRPWEEEDGHGPVREVRGQSDFHYGPAKRPGELVLVQERHWALLYDFAEACRIARKDGWGWLPKELEIIRDEPSKGDGTACGGTAKAGPYEAYDPDNFNRAISAVYAQHRASMTPRQYAAAAAREDFERLRRFCTGDWGYCGVVVTVSRAGVELATASLWGIEDDATDYLDEVSEELANEALDEAKATLVELCDCENEEDA